jgi:hypothetical protein
MATATLAATFNPPISELRPATMDRILVIEHDGTLRKILRRPFSSEGYEVDIVPLSRENSEFWSSGTSNAKGDLSLEPGLHRALEFQPALLERKTRLLVRRGERRSARSFHPLEPDLRGEPASQHVAPEPGQKGGGES